MKKYLLVIIVFVFTALSTNAQEKKVDQLISGENEHLVKIFKEIHKNPELAFMETETSKILADELKNLGYKVITGIAKTGVVGILENGKGPTVMYRADMDCNAVKEVTGLDYASTKTVKLDDGSTTPVMHACGHDAHVTWLIGVAKLMVELKDQWKGTLVLVGQPAEETIEGAQAMVKDGMYKKGVPKPDYLFAMHTAPLPTGTINLQAGRRMAGCDQIDVTFKGIGGHGSSPQFTKDPVLMGASAIVQYQFILSRVNDPQKPAVLTVGSFQSGSDNNVIPADALLKINLRWFDEDSRKLMVEGIKRINNSIALAYNLPKDLYPTMKQKGWSYPVSNDTLLTDIVRKGLLDKKVITQKQIFANFPATMGSEDFHHLVVDAVPDAKYLYMIVGTAKPSDVEEAHKQGKLTPYTNHNGDFKVDLDAIPFGVKIGTTSLLSIFNKKKIKY